MRTSTLITLSLIALLSLSGCNDSSKEKSLSNSAPGRLQTMEGSRHLFKEDGSPFLWLGGTAWGMTEWLTREEVDLYLDDRKSKGINVVQFCLFWGKREEDPVRFTTNPTNAYGHRALVELNGIPNPLEPDLMEGGSPEKPNDYWDHVDYCLQAIAKRDMYAAVLPFWGRRYVNATHPGASMPVFKANNIEQYGEFLGARYGSQPHIIWVNGGDVEAPAGGDNITLYRKFAEGLLKGVSGQDVAWHEKHPAWDSVLMTYHPSGASYLNSSMWFHTDPWLDFNMIETHKSRDEVVEAIRQDLRMVPIKATVLAEGHYEGTTGDKSAKAIHIRRQAYQSFFSGAAGHTYGAAIDGNGNGPLFSPTHNWQKLLNYEGASQLKWLRQLLETHNWGEWIPDPDLILSSRGEGELEKLAVRAKSKIIVYFPENSPVVLNQTRTSKASWFDPRMGSIVEEKNLTPDTLSPPESWEDAVLILEASPSIRTTRNAQRIQPYAANPHYWQYKGKPLLLLGGTKDDSLFQIPDLEEHLDLLASVGGNVIRNTMSDRKDHDFEIYPHKRLESGKYDLNQWNNEYWNRFETMLRLCQERDIIVQIEVWDRFDYGDHRVPQNWVPNPWNPANNINYTSEETGLAHSYPDHHPGRDRQPFFHTIPTMEKYDSRLDIVRFYQERYVAKLLSISLHFPNVLYCMNNETSTAKEWGMHWIQFIKDNATERNLIVNCTDMFDDFHRGAESVKLPLVEGNPKIYDYVDVSQVNSRTFNEDHWNNVYWFNERLRHMERPLNNTKIYSDGQKSFGTGTPVDGVERFWRNLIAGCASCRFHRPDAGIGLNPISQACIRAGRKAESRIKFWDTRPRLDLITNRETDEAYLSAKPGEAYLLYFTDGGSVGLDLSNDANTYTIEWIEIASGEWSGKAGKISGGSVTTISAPGKGGWVATLAK